MSAPDGTPDRPDDDTPDPAAGFPAVTRRTALAVGVPTVAALVGLTALTAPRPARLGEPTGDEALTSAITGQLDGHRHVAVAYLDGSGQTRFGGFGADESTEFEIGSATKTFTGALMAEGIARGEVTAETTVEEILGDEAADSAIADVTLAELATHTSGMPRLGGATLGASLAGTFLRKDPYAGRDADQVIADALATTPSGRGEYAYSNIGAALEGQLLARAAGTDYGSLLAERVLDPLGLAGTYLPLTEAGMREGAPRGHTATGLGSAAWTLDGSAPAGGLRSTAADLAVYLQGTLDGSAPGADAATEVLFEGSTTSRNGMNWFHQDVGDGVWVTFHNGQTGGFASFLGFVPETGRGIVLLTDTARSIDTLGVRVLTGEVAL